MGLSEASESYHTVGKMGRLEGRLKNGCVSKSVGFLEIVRSQFSAEPELEVGM